MQLINNIIIQNSLLISSSTVADPPLPGGGPWRGDGRAAADLPRRLHVPRVRPLRHGRPLQEQAVRHLQEISRPGVHVWHR